jgi:hypothetical protein
VEHRVNSLETDLELLKQDMASCQASIRQDIDHLKETKSELPQWLKNSAVSIVAVMFLQLGTTVWWAAELTTKQSSMLVEVRQNTAFRMEFPKLHEEVMVTLKEIQVNNKHTQRMLTEIKNKLRFVDIKQQVQ